MAGKELSKERSFLVSSLLKLRDAVLETMVEDKVLATPLAGCLVIQYAERIAPTLK